MPNLLDGNGLQTKTKAELVAELTAEYQSIYGADINLESDTPDGQMMNIYIQGYLDLLDLVTQVYNSFDPTNAIGVVLDHRIALNGIQRQAGTFTIQNVDIVLDKAANLYGLDQTVEDVYTVQDNAGTKWLLQITQTVGGSGTVTASFRSEEAGKVLSVPNTITTPVTIVLGVVSVNNPTAYTSLGLDEESDIDVKLRRAESVSLASQGFLEGLTAALKNLVGMNDAFVYENTTSAVDADGIPSHSIWVITSGTSTSAEIGTTIYRKRNAGCGMFGAQFENITQFDGSVFVVNWDNVIQENLFITFTAESINGTELPDIANIRTGLVSSFVPKVNEELNVNTLATKAQEIDSNALITNAKLSRADTQTFDLDAVPASGTFIIRYNGEDTTALNWDDTIVEIRDALRLLTGLSLLNASGSLATQQIVLDLSLIGTIETLLTIHTNSVQDGGAAAIAFTLDIGGSTTINPKTKQYQLALSSPNIIITDMQLLPENSIKLTTETLQLNAFGGYGDYDYAVTTNVSGGSVDTSGLYTAGGSVGTDIITVTDKLGNIAIATVVVN